MTTAFMYPQRAVVAGVDGTNVFVRVPAISTTQRYGPCEQLETPATPGEVTAAGGSPSHTHPWHPTPLAAGDNVLVVFVNASTKRPVILGRLPG